MIRLSQTFLVLMLININVFAEEVRQHGSHAHGVGELNIALEQDLVFVELISPSVNLLGFEHQPTDPNEEQVVKDAVDLLKRAEDQFHFTPAAQCLQQSVELDSSLIDDHEEHADEDGHESDDHEEHADEDGHESDDHEEHADEDGHESDDHEEHADEDGHESDDHEEHADEDGHESDDHEEHADEDTHSSFRVQYQFHCENPKALTFVEISIFENFPLTEELHVQLLSNSSQTSKTLNPQIIRLDL